MPAVLYLLLIVAAAGLCLYVVRRQEARRRNAPGGPGFLEYRTPLAFDECMDLLDRHTPEDEFVYTCRRQVDGSFLFNITLHQPTNQPMDTLFSLRMDTGKETVVSLHFIREAFGYGQPVFPLTMMDAFMEKKLGARRTK